MSAQNLISNAKAVINMYSDKLHPSHVSQLNAALSKAERAVTHGQSSAVLKICSDIVDSALAGVYPKHRVSRRYRTGWE